MNQLQNSRKVIPAEAGIQSFQDVLDPRFRGGDNFFEFCNWLISIINLFFVSFVLFVVEK